MQNSIELNRAIAYVYLTQVAIWPLTILVTVMLIILIALGWAANAVSLWWLLFVLPYGVLLIISCLAVGVGYAMLNALKPRELTKQEKAKIKKFVKFANDTLGEANSLRGGPFGVVFGVLKRRVAGKQSLIDAVVAPLKNTPELKSRYKELQNSLRRKTVENLG